MKNSKEMFFLAIKENNITVVQLLLERGININEKVDGHTPAYFAKSYKHLDIYDFILENGGSLN